MELQYSQRNYDHFYHRFCYSDYRILSEDTLNDGRTSIICAKIRANYTDYYLKIDKMVFDAYRLEKLVELEESIRNGFITNWRPELTGKFEAFPKYNLNYYTKYHNRLLKDTTLFATNVITGSLTAKVYKKNGASTNTYALVADKIYMFGNMTDCETVLRQLAEVHTSSVQDTKQDEIYMNKRLALLNKRLKVHNAVQGYSYKSDALYVTHTGVLIEKCQSA